MRVRRLAILAGCAGAALWTAPAAVGCELTGLSAQGPAGGTTAHPGDAVAYTLYARTTDSSPQDSPYTVNIGSRGDLASGYADPSANGGESIETGTFTMPDLGAGDMTVTVSAVTDSGGYVTTTLHYVGAAAPVQPATQPSAPAPGPPPGGSGTPVQQPAPAVAPATREPVPQARPAHRTLTLRQPAHRSRRAPTPRTAAIVPRRAPAAAPAIVAYNAAKNLTRPAHRRRSAPSARHVSDRVVPVAIAAHAPPSARRHGLPLEVVLVFALLTLAAGGGSAYAVVRRRTPRSPLGATAVDADGAIEAELQEIIAEQRAYANRSDTSSRSPSDSPTSPRA